jgi:hypothetical protein
MYKKSIVILKDSQLDHVVRSVMENRKKEFEKELSLLCRFEEVRKDVRQTRGTANIRKHLSQFIMKNGFPFLTVLDFRADLGLPESEDPDRQKFFRSFLLSFSLLGASANFASKTANLVCFADKADRDRLIHCLADPTLLFQDLPANDDKTRQVVELFKADKEKACRFFNVNVLLYPENGNFNERIREFEEIITLAEKRLTQQAGGHSAAIELITRNLPAAQVICRANEEKVIVNGEVRSLTADEKARYAENAFYFEGAILEHTLETVKQRILQTFSVLPKVKPMKKEAALTLHVSDNCAVDGSFPMSMGIFLTNTIGRHHKLVLNLGKVNLEKLKSVAGYFAIKDLVSPR